MDAILFISAYELTPFKTIWTCDDQLSNNTCTNVLTYWPYLYFGVQLILTFYLQLFFNLHILRILEISLNVCKITIKNVKFILLGGFTGGFNSKSFVFQIFTERWEVHFLDWFAHLGFSQVRYKRMITFLCSGIYYKMLQGSCYLIQIPSSLHFTFQDNN